MTCNNKKDGVHRRLQLRDQCARTELTFSVEEPQVAWRDYIRLQEHCNNEMTLTLPVANSCVRLYTSLDVIAPLLLCTCTYAINAAYSSLIIGSGTESPSLFICSNRGRLY